jgi:acyl-CoA thioester hydrolase
LGEDGVIEVWRGDVGAWECDEMEHMNVRFYLDRAMQGLAGVAAAFGMPHAFAAHATSSLIVREHHVRFLHEARAGAPLHMTAGVVAMEETEATLLQTLVHSLTGTTAATFVTRIAHVAARDGRPFPWPARALAAAERLKVEVPAEAGSRSVSAAPLDVAPSLERAEAAGMARTARAVVSPVDCDVFGRLRPELVIGLISQGIPHLIAPVREATAAEGRPGVRVGGAALEHRLVYFGAPRAGDHLELRSGLVAVERTLTRMRHWLLDPITGLPWAAVENISICFDLDARKVLRRSEAAVTALQPLALPA